MDKLVNSFVNYTFSVGEWLIHAKILNSDIIEDMEGEIILGIPSLAILNCISFTSQFEDSCVRLATGSIVSLDDVSEEIRPLLEAVLQAVKLFRQIDFNYVTYEAFRIKLFKSFNEYTFDETDDPLQKQLREIIYGITLQVTQIREYKENYLNVIELLKSIC